MEQSRFTTRLKHYDDLGTAWFVTFSCYYRLPSLNRPGAKEMVIEELDRARAKDGFHLLGYVLMRFPTAELWGTPMVWYRNRLNGIGRVTTGIRVEKLYL